MVVAVFFKGDMAIGPHFLKKLGVIILSVISPETGDDHARSIRAGSAVNQQGAALTVNFVNDPLDIVCV